VRDAPGLHLDHPPAVNALFPCLPAEVIRPLQAWCPFYDWEPARNQVRWMTAWDTSEADVDAFAAGIRAALGAG
jgi:threonine aldolase